MLDIRKHFLTKQTDNYSSRLPGQAPGSPSLEAGKNRLGRHNSGVYQPHFGVER